MISVQVSGRIFERPNLQGPVVQAVTDAAVLVKDRAHAKLASLFRRGPGRWGEHLADSLRWNVRSLAGASVIGTVYPTKFTGIILEGGAPRHYILPRSDRPRSGVTRGRARRHFTQRRPLAFALGGGPLLFRQFVRHPGLRAFQWSTQTQRETAPQVVALVERAVERALNG